METDFSCGIIPIHATPEGGRELLVVQHGRGHWGFPKGHPEEGEDPRGAAQREFTEETGITAYELMGDEAFEEAYVFTKKSGKVVRKRVRYFLAAVADKALHLQPEEIDDAAWGDAKATRDRLTFEEGRDLLDRVLAHLDAAGQRR